MSDNWVVQNLENALETWNEKLAEIWQLITTTPQDFKGGGIWGVIVNINGAVQAIGLALLVLFFVVGVVKTCGSFTEVKKPEHALKLFIRFAIAKGAITYGMELMLSLFNIVQGTISTIMSSAGFSSPQQTTLPAEMITTIEDCGFFESIPLWAVTLIGGLFITVMSFILIMTVYGRFFKLYMYTALAPIPLSTFAGEPSQNVGKSFIKSYCAVLLKGAVIVLSVLHYILGVCFFSARGGYKRSRRNASMELCGGTHFQYACVGWCGKNERPYYPRDDGIIKGCDAKSQLF